MLDIIGIYSIFLTPHTEREDFHARLASRFQGWECCLRLNRKKYEKPQSAANFVIQPQKLLEKRLQNLRFNRRSAYPPLIDLLLCRKIRKCRDKKTDTTDTEKTDDCEKLMKRLNMICFIIVTAATISYIIWLQVVMILQYPEKDYDLPDASNANNVLV